MEKIIGNWSTRAIMTGGEAKDICKLGQGEDVCAFLVASVSGFGCIRMDYPTNTPIFSRLKDGTINAKGEGGWKGCVWVDELEPKLDYSHEEIADVFAREKAAQVWCDKRTKNKVMDVELAEVFAEILKEATDKIETLNAKIEDFRFWIDPQGWLQKHKLIDIIDAQFNEMFPLREKHE